MDILEFLVAVLAFISVLVGFITQSTKGIGFLDRIPTKAQVLVLSYVITVPVIVWGVCIIGCTMQWYTWFCLIIAAPLVVAKCASDGYEWIFELYDHYKQYRS